MKKISLIVVVLVFALITTSFSLASGDDVAVSSSSTETTATQSEKYEVPQEVKDNAGNASETTIKNLTTKDEKIEEYSKKLGSKTNGIVLYYLEVVRDYSFPVCFVGLAIASLNFFIIGNKKLEKREQGFNMLVTLIVGLIVFQVLPLLFAIIVAGRWYTNEGSFRSW